MRRSGFGKYFTAKNPALRRIHGGLRFNLEAGAKYSFFG
jgi:hypothetical protein